MERWFLCLQFFFSEIASERIAREGFSAEILLPNKKEGTWMHFLSHLSFLPLDVSDFGMKENITKVSGIMVVHYSSSLLKVNATRVSAPVRKGFFS